jgi:hypothetical protein
MKNGTMLSAVAVSLFFTGYYTGHESTSVVHAQGIPSVPRGWGHCVGSAGPTLILEDSDGVIRLIDPSKGTVEMQLDRK